MRCRLVRQMLSIVAFGALSALTLAGPVQAQVIDFESQAQDFYADGSSVTQAGFSFTQIGDFGVIADSSSFFIAQAPQGSDGQFYSVLNDSQVALSRGDGVTFNLDGFDAGFVSPVPQDAGVVAGRLVLIGTKVGGMSFTTSFEFGASDDSGNFSFQHFASGLGDFRNIASVEFLACVYVAGGGCANPADNLAQFSLDNVGVTVVPEPSTYALMALGLCGIAAYSRRARR